MSRDQEVLDSMRGIIDPDLGKDIVTLGFIKNLTISDAGDVAFMVELTTPACPVKEQFQIACTEAVSALSWVKDVKVSMGAQARRGAPLQGGPGLKGVKHVVAVASCKGGVGKSTVAVNFAFGLAAQGARVGIFDADIYGPSLPTMVSVPFDGLFQNQDNLIIPVMYRGVKLMSFAYAAPKQGAPAVMRGPMVTSVVNQLLTTTDWGELDYLVIDMPPGTGDIQLTLSQIIPITAAVIVTTPQEISFVDVVKGIKMFDMMKIPTVAVVENMSYFQCDGCDKQHRIFGSGAMRRLVDQFGIRNAIELALDPQVAAHSDQGTPIIVAKPAHPVSRGYLELVNAVVREISILLHADKPKPMVRYDGKHVLFAPGDGTEFRLHPARLRRSCRCASCINEMTGEKTLRDDEIPETVSPQQLGSLGNYAVTIEWSDGHHSIYPFDMLAKLAAEATAAAAGVPG